jgi:DNA-binding MarR family transcriptional regulator
MNNSEILNRMESLLQELADRHKPQFIDNGPVGTTLDVISRDDLTPTQRLIILYLLFNASMEPVTQREIYTHLGIANKTARENLEGLLAMGIVNKGIRSYTWEIAH